jgi:hypothetical protein
MTTQSTVSLMVEVPEALHDALRSYLDTHPTWDQDRTFTAALAQFLLQGPGIENPLRRAASRIYLDTLFKRHGDIRE